MDANAFKKRRVALGRTQAQLAADLELGERTLRRWESGAAPIPRAVELALCYLAGEVRPDPEAPPHE